MSNIMKNINKAVMFIIFIILIETIFVRLFIATPTESSQWVSTIRSLLILVGVLFALYLYQNRGNKNVAALTLSVLGGYVLAKGLYHILTTGNIVVREGRIFQVYIGNIILGSFFILYALLVWRFGAPALSSREESTLSRHPYEREESRDGR
nr:hypothetical protein [Ardenticatena sp.]